MERALHNAHNTQRILQLTADTMLLIDRNGICIDIDCHSNLWFLQEEQLLGKNIFELMPEYTKERFVPIFETVLCKQQSVSKNFKLEIGDNTYYFKCLMYPYDDKVLCSYRDITQRSNVKHLLEQAKHNLREIQKVAQIGQWMHNTKDDYLCFIGYTDILSTNEIQRISLDKYQELIIEDDLPLFQEWMDKNLKGFNDESISYRVRVKGEIYYSRIQTYLRKEGPDGSYDIEGYIQNITDIQRGRNDINTLTHAINNAKESIFAAKEDGTLLFANRQFMQHYGILDKEDIGKMKIYNIVGDVTTLELWQKRCNNVQSGAGSYNFITHHPLKEEKKDILAFEGIMYSVTSDSGETSFWSFTHDISERIRYEAEIKRLNLVMNATIDNMPAGIVMKDAENDFRYIYCNQESYNRDSRYGNVIGKNDFDCYSAETATAKRQEDTEVATTGNGVHWVTEGKDRNGNVIFLDKKKIRVGGNGLFSPIIISIEWDITELEMMKRELQMSKEKAEMSDKLKSAFLANMSHEIRTPLNAIVGFSHLIAESDDIEERKSYYEIVEANNERLLHLINEILDLSKIESGIVEFSFAPVNLNYLCKEVHASHIFRTPEGVQLIYEPSNQALTIETDKNRVFQVISNMIGNAFKFTKEGSVRFGYELKDNLVVFHVKDTGTGIETGKLHHIFERFAKLNNYAQGTGLGLSICKTIIERFGGQISVASEAGKGTTFTFTLPYQSAEGQNGEYAPLPEDIAAQTLVVVKEKPTDNKATILIAEDTDNNYDLLNAILGRTYNLLRARDGMEAVTMYDSARPDLILMDIKMPNLDGLEATRIIRELSPTVPIIIQSAFAFEHDRAIAKGAGCNDFISKPISQKLLKEVIQKWLP